jgi:hypothetical protein
MIIQTPKRLNLDSDAVLSEAVDRISIANRLTQGRWAVCRC